MVLGFRCVPTTAFLAFVALATCLGETDLVLPFFASAFWTFSHAWIISYYSLSSPLPGRVLRELAADRIIEFDRHRIVILEPDRLVEVAEV